MTDTEINFIGVFLVFIGTFLFINNFLFPYIHSLKALNRRLDKAGKSTNEGGFLQEQEALRRQENASTVDKKLSEFFKYTPTFSSKFQNFLYRSGFFTYTKLFLLFFIALVFVYHLIAIVIFKGLTLKAVLFSFSMGFLTFFAYLKAREHIWVKKVIKQFPSALDIINRSLKAGLPLKRGITLVAEEMPNPIGGEFRYMEAQFQIGVSPVNVFTEASGRIVIEDFRLFTIALLLQQEMGGSLSDILVKLYDVLAEREKIRLKISILSTEAKTSSWIVSCLPFFVAGIIEYLNPGYLSFFFDTSSGNIMLGIITLLTVVGTITIKRMTKFTEE